MEGFILRLPNAFLCCLLCLLAFGLNVVAKERELRWWSRRLTTLAHWIFFYHCLFYPPKKSAQNRNGERTTQVFTRCISSTLSTLSCCCRNKLFSYSVFFLSLSFQLLLVKENTSLPPSSSSWEKDMESQMSKATNTHHNANADADVVAVARYKLNRQLPKLCCNWSAYMYVRMCVCVCKTSVSNNPQTTDWAVAFLFFPSLSFFLLFLPSRKGPRQKTTSVLLSVLTSSILLHASLSVCLSVNPSVCLTACLSVRTHAR